MSSFDIASNVINTEVPYFPSYTWGLTQADFGGVTLWTFNWIQAFWDTTNFTGTPALVVSTGETRDDGTLIASLIQFAYSGERINFKAKAILSTGVDRRGITVVSTAINASAPVTSFTKVIAYGGNY